MTQNRNLDIRQRLPVTSVELGKPLNLEKEQLTTKPAVEGFVALINNKLSDLKDDHSASTSLKNPCLRLVEDVHEVASVNQFVKRINAVEHSSVIPVTELATSVVQAASKLGVSVFDLTTKIIPSASERFDSVNYRRSFRDLLSFYESYGVHFQTFVAKMPANIRDVIDTTTRQIAPVARIFKSFNVGLTKDPRGNEKFSILMDTVRESTFDLVTGADKKVKLEQLLEGNQAIYTKICLMAETTGNSFADCSNVVKESVNLLQQLKVASGKELSFETVKAFINAISINEKISSLNFFAKTCLGTQSAVTGVGATTAFLKAFAENKGATAKPFHHTFDKGDSLSPTVSLLHLEKMLVVDENLKSHPIVVLDGVPVPALELFFKARKSVIFRGAQINGLDTLIIENQSSETMKGILLQMKRNNPGIQVLVYVPGTGYQYQL